MATATSTTVLQKLKKFVAIREKHFASLNATYNLSNKLDTRSDEFIVRAQRADLIFEQFESAQNEIMSLNTIIDSDNQMDVGKASSACEDIYFRIKAVQRSLERSSESPRNVTLNTEPPKARIPKIIIEPFSGQFEKFQNFKSLFDTLIHGSNMSTIEKFSYLRSLLQGKALSVIQSIEFNEGNYEFAYKRLCDEYSNKRLVATHFFNKILAQKNLSSETPEVLREFGNTFFVYSKALKDLALPDLADLLLLHLALRAIPPDTQKLFETEHIGSKNIPTLNQLDTFLQNRFSVLEMVEPSVKITPRTSAKKSFMTTQEDTNLPRPSSSTSNSICKYCKNTHKLSACPEFSKLDVAGRRDFIKKEQLCYACFGNHSVKQCSSIFSCRVCRKRSHHTLLHFPTDKPPWKPLAQALTCNIPSVQTLDSKSVLLGTAMAQVQDIHGRWHPIRLVIDPGSMVNFVTNSMAQSLQLARTKHAVNIAGIGDTKLQSSKGMVQMRLKGQPSSSKILDISAVVLSSISNELPTQPVSRSTAMKFRNLLLADYSIFEKSSSVDMLIGASHFAEILRPDKTVISGKPSCLSTIFGYVLIGEVETPSHDSPQTSLLTIEAPLNDVIKRLWEIEEVSQPKIANPEDALCEQHFMDTHHRDSTGRFVVSLPFKGNTPPQLGSTRNIALQRFKSLETRLEKDPSLKSLYHRDIQGYIDEDQIEIAQTPAQYVLPHHAVVKNSSSHPLRIVFNASQASNNSQTLNKAMYVGPKLQQDVGDVIVLFRLHTVALCADIRQMYRAILLNPTDRIYQHIFWRFHPGEEIQEWELKRLTFGFGPASFLAQRCLRALAEGEKDNYPHAAQVLLDGCYVDDIVTGAPTPHAARELREDLVSLLHSAGFSLKKFASSSPEVLYDVPLEDQEKCLTLDSSESIKILGLHWEPKSDSFCYTLNQKHPVMTKRGLLSCAASIFDVNGYITHLVIVLKILIQKLWLLQIDWDDPVPTAIQTQWAQFSSELPLLKDLRIPRCVTAPQMVYELVGFSDASSQAVAALVYLRSINPNGEVKECNLMRAKSKVAPLKVLSIPRLELVAAHLLMKVLNSLQFLGEQLKIKHVYCFSDSTTVLSWIQTPPHELKTFVANRVSEIIGFTSPNQWKYVPTGRNPADLATRGLSPSQVLDQQDFWFHGPDFLLQNINAWPKSPSFSTQVPELKDPESTVLISSTNQIIDYFEKFSCLRKLQRVTAWCLRFTSNARNPNAKNLNSELSVAELNDALNVCIKVTQQNFYKAELNNLDNCENWLTKLSPFISPSGILMVGGRLKNAPLPYTSKHPILLPQKSHLAKLLVDHYHAVSLHGNPKLVQSLIQRKFWIPALRNLTKARIFRCLKCYKLSAKLQAPLMGDLPHSRFAQGRCFINTAIDFAGPFLLKDGGRRNSPIKKCYMVVFVCMAVKAIHLELANALTMESCLAALDRFIARRGKPDHIYSDQGTNFKASARHIDEVQCHLQDINTQIMNHLHRQGIVWHFHPPGAPNFSGLVEAGVKAAKYHLKRILDDRALNQEEFTTLLAQVEAILNSRPLCAVNNLPDEGTDYLTPGHFLIGAPLMARPEHDQTKEIPGRLCRWKLLTQAMQCFWKRWSQEYIHTQIQRPKWTKSGENIKVGDLVLIYSETAEPLKWPLARVIETFPGTDQVVRVVKVKTATGTFTRSVNKIVVLPLAA